MLDATTNGEVSYNWQPDGSMSPSVLIDSLSSVNGTKIVNVTITSSKGCSVSKDIQVHFNNPSVQDSFTIYPNPSNGIFILEPLKGSAVIDQMRLVDNMGNVVWNNEESLNIVGSKQISISGLTGGSYLLVTENKNGRSVSPLVIQ